VTQWIQTAIYGLRHLITAGAMLAPAVLSAQSGATSRPALPDGRVVRTINEGWRFAYGGQQLAERFSPLVEPGKFKPFERAQDADAGWEQVTLPHTWNTQDPFDDVAGYRRGIGWYRKMLVVDSSYAGRRLFLHFEGANEVADVYVNGAFAGRHEGGYTAFSVDVTRFIELGARNLIAVQVNNAHDPYIAPLSVGYAIYGGLYRDVWLVATAPVHVALGDHGDRGVRITTPALARDSAVVEVSATVANDGATPATVRVEQTLTNAQGAVIGTVGTDVTLTPRSQRVVTQRFATLRTPHLWSPDDPYLHRVHTDVVANGARVDRVTEPLGLRWVRFSGNGVELNGQKLLLRGTNRHQDRQGFGSALSNAQHRRDLEMIKAMGANFLRLGHYPQDPAVLTAADELGILLWEEIPVVDYINPVPRFTENTTRMLREMIRQHRNHPSVIVWGLMNEPLLKAPDGERVSRQNDTTYLRQLRALSLHLDSTAHAEDPSRGTTMALHGSDDYDTYDIGGVTTAVGVNRYDGWYSGKFEDFGPGLDKRHARHPQQALFVSEYGAEDDYRVNALEPERFDFSGTWTRRFHESYLRQMAARPWLAGTAVWNQFDFAQPEVGGSIPYRNQKGLQTWDRGYKDVYYLYQANWTRAPMVHIASTTWTRRTGTDTTAPVGAGPRAVRQPVDVYSNAERVELLLNGRSLGVKTPDDVKRLTWDVPFVDGDNVVEARATSGGKTLTDKLVIHFAYQAPTLADASVPFRELAVNVGGKAEVVDADGVIWVGDRPYTPGRYGYIGGEATQLSKELPVRGTPQTPLYFTHRAGIEGYRFDVPDGDYELELRFVEPTATGPKQRVFDVRVNGRTVVANLDLLVTAGTGWAVPITTTVHVQRGEGVQVTFPATVGKAVLSGIRVRAQ
jgi:beta-galactosidase